MTFLKGPNNSLLEGMCVRVCETGKNRKEKKDTTIS